MNKEQRGNAIQKILNQIARHLGRELLPKEKEAMIAHLIPKRDLTHLPFVDHDY